MVTQGNSNPRCTITYANPILPSTLGRFRRRHRATVERLLALRR